MDKTVIIGRDVYLLSNYSIYIIKSDNIIIFQPLEKYSVKDISLFCNNLFFLTADGFLFCYYKFKNRDEHIISKFYRCGVERFVEICQYVSSKKEMAVYCKNKLIFFSKQFINHSHRNTLLMESWDMDLDGKIDTSCVNNLYVFIYKNDYVLINISNGVLIMSSERKQYMQIKYDVIPNIKKIRMWRDTIFLLTIDNEIFYREINPNIFGKYLISDFNHAENIHDDVYISHDCFFIMCPDKTLSNANCYTIPPCFFSGEKLKHYYKHKKFSDEFYITNKRIIQKYYIRRPCKKTYNIPVPKIVYLIIFGHYDKNSILNRLPFDVLKIVVRYIFV